MSYSKKKKKQTQHEAPSWAKYMGLSFQLFAVIGGGTALGWWIQGKSAMKFPVWLLLFCFASIALAFYQLWKSMQQDR